MTKRQSSTNTIKTTKSIILSMAFYLCMYRLPKRNNQQLKWINYIRRCRPDWSPKIWSYVCSHHFTPEDFDCKDYLHWRLRDGAAPSVFHAPAPSVSWTRRQPVTRTKHSRQQSTALRGNLPNPLLCSGDKGKGNV